MHTYMHACMHTYIQPTHTTNTVHEIRAYIQHIQYVQYMYYMHTYMRIYDKTTTNRVLTRLLRGILLYLFRFWDPFLVPLSPKRICFSPQGLLNSRVEVVSQYVIFWLNEYCSWSLLVMLTWAIVLGILEV